MDMKQTRSNSSDLNSRAPLVAFPHHEILHCFFPSLVGLGMASAILEDHQLVARGGPSDTSVNSQFSLACQGTTLPNGNGDGGTSYWGGNLILYTNGNKFNADSCTTDNS